MQHRFHTVPAGYLARYAQPTTREGVLLAVDVETGRIRESIPDHEAYRTDYYLLDSGEEDPLAVECLLTEADTYLAEFVRHIERDERLPPAADLNPLLEVLALLVSRNPKFGDGANLAFEAIVGLIGLMCGDSGMRHDREVRAMAGPFRACLSAVGATPVHQDFRRRTWSLLIAKAGAGEFVTSDAPVGLETRWGPGWMHGGALSQPESKVVVPLTPRMAMVGRLGGRRRIRRVGYPTVAALNGTTIRLARKFIYARSRDFWWRDAEGRLQGSSDLRLQRVRGLLAS